MHRKLKRTLIALLVFAALAAVGITLAFMFKRVNTVNTFTPARVSCTVSEKLDGKDAGGSGSGTTTVDGKEKSDIRVKNTGNVKEYLRVRLVSYFVNEDGDISGAEPSVYPSLTLKDGWLAGSEHTYYYTLPVAPDNLTPMLCEPFTLSEKTDRNGKTLRQVVEVFAEAIQADPDTAAEEAWNVTIENGTVTAAK